MNKDLEKSLLKGELVLFLGAGASLGSMTSRNELIPDSKRLAEKLCTEIDIDYSGESLSQVYAVSKRKLGEKRLSNFFEGFFKFCKYSQDYKTLVELPFKRVYSLNIDDCFEQAFHDTVRDRNLDIKSSDDFVTEYSYFNNITTLIKLNGDINKIDKGFIFSAQEYASNMSKSLNWYNELAKDMHTYTFLFIGTKLNEPLLQYHLEMFRRNNSVNTSSRGYVVTPEISEIERLSLEENNLYHIKGKLSDVTSYFKSTFDNSIPKNEDIARNINPYMIRSDKDLNIVSKITPINSNNLPSSTFASGSLNDIRDFYRGFKPTWQDILDEVPALLSKTKKFLKNSLSKDNNPRDLFIIHGVAGSGKSTALKQIALYLSNNKENKVYFINNDYEELDDVLNYLDHINEKPFYVAIDRIISNRYHELLDIINKGNTKAIFLITENTALWESKVKPILGSLVTDSLNISTIEEEDVNSILEKLQKFGSWTRLEKMSVQERRKQLISKSSKQLLIGLLELTSGLGYQEIINRDFNSIKSRDKRNLLLLASIPALENMPSNEQTLNRALIFLNKDFNLNVKVLAEEMKGIIQYTNGEVVTRHRIYSEKIFNISASDELKENLLKAYIRSFINYSFPIVQNISKREGNVYKHLVNYKFLIRFLNGDESSIIGLYEYFEKSLENEGLFLLQYGLALRHFKHPIKAYEKLIVAQNAFPTSPHIEHALAQQKMILASENTTYHNLNRENLFHEAEITLNRLAQVEAGVFKNDSYPLVTLSKGHVNYLIYLNRVDDAKFEAKKYFSRVQEHVEYNSSPYLKEVATELMNYNLFGTWKHSY